jgi:hypothetical protein
MARYRLHPMRVVLLGGVPGVGKTSVARQLLHIAAHGTSLVQWVDVDALWLHQPWRVDERTKRMVQSNLAAVMNNGLIAGVEVLLVTWVFQSPEMHALVRRLAPPEVSLETIQLHVDETTWRTVPRALAPTMSSTPRSSIPSGQLRRWRNSLGFEMFLAASPSLGLLRFSAAGRVLANGEDPAVRIPDVQEVRSPAACIARPIDGHTRRHNPIEVASTEDDFERQGVLTC